MIPRTNRVRQVTLILQSMVIPEKERIILFSIIQLSRPVSLIVPAYDYCIPCKDCSGSSASEAPCEVFDRIEFPTEQFFPQPNSDENTKCCCNETSVCCDDNK